MSTKPSIHVLGTDPGINTLGWALLSYNPDTQITTVSNYGTIESNNLAKKEFKQEFKQYSRIISLSVYEREFKQLMDQYRPDFVVSESAFYNPRMPNAFLSLSLCIYTVQKLLYRDYNKPLFTVAPKEAKAVVFSGTANKIAVQEGIRQLSDLVLKDSKTRPLDKMVEHEADAIAIGYSFIKLMLPDMLLQTKS